MYVISLLTSIEAAVDGPKKQVGLIKHADDLIERRSLETFMIQYPLYCYAFLAFDAGAPSAVRAYIEGESLPSDSGNNVMILLTLDYRARSPMRYSSLTSPSIELQAEQHQSYILASSLYGGVPLLPALMFFRSFAPGASVVSVSLQGLSDVASVQQRVQTACKYASDVYAKHRGEPSRRSLQMRCRRR